MQSLILECASNLFEERMAHLTATHAITAIASDSSTSLGSLESPILQLNETDICADGDLIQSGSSKDRSDCPDQDQLVYVIDDDTQIRRSMHFLLSTTGRNCWPYACAADFLDNLPNLKPAPILLDIRMPDIDGIELLSRLVDREVRWPVIIITAHADISIAVKAMRLGAIDFLEKPINFAELEPLLADAFSQLAAIKNTATNRANAHRLFDRLSRRELEVLLVLMDGLPNKIAAGQLSLSARTVEMHRSNALRKLEVKSIAEAVRLASESGITFRENIRPANVRH